MNKSGLKRLLPLTAAEAFFSNILTSAPFGRVFFDILIGSLVVCVVVWYYLTFRGVLPSDQTANCNHAYISNFTGEDMGCICVVIKCNARFREALIGPG